LWQIIELNVDFWFYFLQKIKRGRKNVLSSECVSHTAIVTALSRQPVVQLLLKQLMNNTVMQMSLFTMPYKWSPATLRELIGTTNQVGRGRRERAERDNVRKKIEQNLGKLGLHFNIQKCTLSSYCEQPDFRILHRRKERFIQMFITCSLFEPLVLIIITRMKWLPWLNNVTYQIRRKDQRQGCGNVIVVAFAT